MRTYRPACVWLDARLPEKAVLGYHDPGRENLKRAGFLSYLRGHPLQYLPTTEAVQAFLAADPRAVVVVEERADHPSLLQARIATWNMGMATWHALGGAEQRTAGPVTSPSRAGP